MSHAFFSFTSWVRLFLSGPIILHTPKQIKNMIICLHASIWYLVAQPSKISANKIKIVHQMLIKTNFFNDSEFINDILIIILTKVGLEPTTYGLWFRYSTNWVISFCMETIGLEPITLCMQSIHSTNWVIPPFCIFSLLLKIYFCGQWDSNSYHLLGRQIIYH